LYRPSPGIAVMRRGTGRLESKSMEVIPFAENAAQRDRLARLAGSLTGLDRLSEVNDGWTVGAMLGHLAFWDSWARCLIHRWRSGEMPPPSLPAWYDEAVNETLLPLWRALRPAVAASLALEAAQAVDHELTRLETPVLAAIVATGESNLLHRHQHRREHLDQIERLIAGAGT
jgi:hypothetical protein